MNPNVTYINHNPNNISGMYRVNPSTTSTASMDHHHNNNNNGNGNTGSGGSGGITRSMTRNSILSYASTPSWVNPSTMIDPSPARTSRPLPDPQASHGNVDIRAHGHVGHGPGGGGHPHGHGDGYGGHNHEPSGYYVTNVTDIEEEEEEYVDDPPPSGGGGGMYGYPGMGYPGGYSTNAAHMLGMPIGMGGPNGMGVPMERVAPPGRRPLPIPGAAPPHRNGLSGGNGAKKGRAFVGGFFGGLKRLPKTVLRYGSRSKKRTLKDEDDGDEDDGRDLGMGGMMRTGSALPQYTPHRAMPNAGQANMHGRMGSARGPQATLDDMPGALPSSPPPEIRTRPRGPSLTVTPPSGESLNRQYMQPPVDENPTVVDYPPPNLERGRTTVMMYHEPTRETIQPTRPTTNISEESVTPAVVRQPTPRPSPPMMSGVLGSNHTSQNLSNEGGVRGSGPNGINSAVTPPRNVHSPMTGHPGPANDYLKMTTSPRTATHATEVTEYTSYTEDVTEGSDMNPVFRFFHAFYHLPWISERSTVDYSPLAGFGGKGGGRGVVKKSSASWYKKRGEGGRMGVTSVSLDLLNGVEGDTGSILSPLGGWRRRIGRRNTVDNVPGRSRHHHTRHHSPRHGHGHGHHSGHGHSGHGHSGHGHNGTRRHRYRRRSTSTITFEEYHHQRIASPVVPPMYPYPFASPPYPYFQVFPAAVAGSPAQADTSITANQGTPGLTGTGGAGGGQGTSRERSGNQPQVQTQTTQGLGAASGSGTTPRGPRQPWGSRTAMFPHGYAAYPPSPPMVFMAAGGEEGGGGGGGGGGVGGGVGGGANGVGGRRVVYMPMVPGAFQYE